MELVRTVRVRVDGGLHARPAAEIVRLSRAFSSEIVLEAHARTAVAKSSMKLLLLGVKEGDEVTVRVLGEDAEQALDSLSSYLTGHGTDGQGQAMQPAAGPEPSSSARTLFQGVAVSQGLAIGPVFALRQPDLSSEPTTVPPDLAERELSRALAAQSQVAESTRQAADSACQPATREVLSALVELVDDPDWTETITSHIRSGASAMAAVRSSAAARVDAIAALPDIYASARAEDMRAAGDLVMLALQGKRPLTLSDAPAGSVVVADELAAVNLGHADLTKIAGLVTARGAATGHAAILARAAGVPAVFGLGDAIAAVLNAGEVGLDGATGEVFPDPDGAAKARFAAAAAERLRQDTEYAAYKTVRPVTRDGVAVTTAANIGSLADAQAAKTVGAMGVGLFRTEFLFLDRNSLPAEEEQYRTYRAVLEQFPDHHVIIRTMDIGGDKPARALPMEPEDNPFLGLRGIRLCLKRPDVFRIQLRALLRAACHGRLQVMLPMVSDLSELVAVRQMIVEESDHLSRDSVAYRAFPLGIMVETPAAVMQADDLARACAFFSIGTNDLTQYIMAADRLNPQVASLCRADNPAVIAAIRRVCAAAASAGIPVGVCGEAGGDPSMIPILLKSGVRELSMSPNAIARAKAQICGLTLTGS